MVSGCCCPPSEIYAEYSQALTFLLRNKPRYLKAEDIYGLAKKTLAAAHEMPYAETVVTSLESLTEALLQKTALIHTEEGSHCLASLDELVPSTIIHTHNRISVSQKPT